MKERPQKITRGAPSAMHEYRCQILETIAILADFHGEITLPDGRVPDIARFSPTRRTVFLGDAKHSEDPRNAASLGRLRHYAFWLANTGDTLAVCHRAGQSPGWSRALTEIGHDVFPQEELLVRSRRVALDAEVTWLTKSGRRSIDNKPDRLNPF